MGFIAPVDAAVGALLGRPANPDVALGLAKKNVCVLTFLGESIKPTVFKISRGGESTWYYFYGDAEDKSCRRVAWAPYPGSDGWNLTVLGRSALLDSKDLMWLLLRFYEAPKQAVPSCYGYCLMKHFGVKEVCGHVDPERVLPVVPSETQSGVMARLVAPHNNRELRALAAAISGDDWWELYIARARNDNYAPLTEFGYNTSSLEAYRTVIGYLSGDREIRVFDIAILRSDIGDLAEACAYSSKGPLLVAAMGAPQQNYEVNKDLLLNIIRRKHIDDGCMEALVLYLQRCSRMDLKAAILNLLADQEYPEDRITGMCVGATKVLVEGTSGLGIPLDPSSYMRTFYLSSLMVDAHGAMRVSATYTQDLCLAHAEVAVGIRLAAKALHESGYYLTPEAAAAAIVERAIVMCPEDQKSLSRELLLLLYGAADDRKLLKAYCSHPSTASQIAAATASERTLRLFGLCYRPWLPADMQIADAGTGGPTLDRADVGHIKWPAPMSRTSAILKRRR